MPKVRWQKVYQERYCVDSGRPVQMVPGDRCRDHGGRRVACYTAIRDPRCKHPFLSKNHPYPKCSECGNFGEVVKEESTS